MVGVHESCNDDAALTEGPACNTLPLTCAEAAVYCKALADPNRMKLVTLLLDGERCGCALLEQCDFTQPTLSHHMKILCEAGLVRARKAGKWSHYSLNVTAMEALGRHLIAMAHAVNASEAC